MKHEQVFLNLLPVLESYVKTVLKKYNDYTDTEEVFSDCVMNVISAIDKNDIKEEEVEKYMIGVVRRATVCHKRKEFREREVLKGYSERSIASRGREIIKTIDEFVEGNIEAVWEGLKLFRGNVSKVVRGTGMSRNIVDRYKQELDSYYNKILVY